jgi:hypothetical protein
MNPATLSKLRAVSCDPALVAVIGCAAGVAITSPSIVRLLHGSDGTVYGKPEGGSSFSLLIGDWSQLFNAIMELAVVAGLTDEQRNEVLSTVTSAMEPEPVPTIRLPRCPGRARFTEVP